VIVFPALVGAGLGVVFAGLTKLRKSWIKA
jgi:hypothetical protein